MLNIWASQQSGVPFNPASLFVGGVQGTWHDIDLPYLYTDTALTTNATAAGQTIRGVLDRSGNGWHWTNATGVILRQDVNGKYYLEHSATQFLNSATGFLVSYPHYMIAACFKMTANAGQVLTVGVSNTSKVALSSATQFSRMTCESRPGIQVLAQSEAGSVSFGTPTVLEGLIEEGSQLCAMNGGADVTIANTLTNVSNQIANARTGLNITGAAAAAAVVGGFYGGIILSDKPNAATRAKLVRHFKGKCGLLPLEGYTYDLFALAGQSNCVGQGDVTTVSSVTFGKAVQYLYADAIKPLGEQMRHRGWEALDTGNLATTGSLWPAFANAYYAATGRRLLFCAGSHGNQGLTNGNWQPAGTYLSELATLVANARVYIAGRGGTISGPTKLMWLGGESDAQSAVAKATFKAAFIALLGRVRTAFSEPTAQIYALSIDRSDSAGQDAGFQAIRDAISEACSETAGMNLVLPYQDYAGQGLLKADTTPKIHWIQAALEDAGTKAGAATGALV